jgi:hypothetical protein
MRRAFCKNWWNDRWRSLQSAFMSWLSQEAPEISIHVGDCGKLTLAAEPVDYESPISIEEKHAVGEEEALDSSLEDQTAGEDIEQWEEIEAAFENDSTEGNHA